MVSEEFKRHSKQIMHIFTISANQWEDVGSRRIVNSLESGDRSEQQSALYIYHFGSFS